MTTTMNTGAASLSDEMERAYQRRHALIVTDREDFEAGYRAAIAAGGAQEPDVFKWLETELSAISCRYHGDPSYDHDAYWMKDRVMKLIADARKAFALPHVAATVVLTKQVIGNAWRDCGAVSNSPPDWAIQFAQNIARALLAASNGEKKNG